MISNFISNRFKPLYFLAAASLLLVPIRSIAAEAAEADREACRKNLSSLYSAIQAYRAENKDLPAWLSDLVPKHIKDPNALICPTVKRTGSVETFGLEDPKISTAYTYEFADAPIPKSIQGGADRTMKEWKRRQMGLLGSKVPMIRCHHHKPVLNVNFDGKVYESEGAWENDIKEVDAAELFPARIFANEAAWAATARAKTKIPARDASAGANLIDLSQHYNAALSESWHPSNPGDQPSNNLEWLPHGVQKFGGIPFDARGIIQLSSKKLSMPRYPLNVRNIKVDQKASRLHFLHSTGWSAAEGTPVASYVIHYANGETSEFTILYGNHMSDWVNQGDPKDTTASMIAWAGKSPANNWGTTLHVYKTQWTNPAPDQTIASIDFVSANLDPAPFLIGITAETP